MNWISFRSRTPIAEIENSIGVGSPCAFVTDFCGEKLNESSCRQFTITENQARKMYLPQSQPLALSY